MGLGTEKLERELIAIKSVVNAIYKKICYSGLGTDITDILSIVSLEQGSIPAGKKAVSFQNTGDSEILIKGIAIPSGDTIEFSASDGNLLDEISYDAQLSTILIITLE